MIGTIIPPVVVLDATGVVGRGVVAAALQAGRPVIAVGTDPAALDALARRSGPGMTTLAGSARDEAAAARLADGLRALRRPVGGVIVPLQPLALRGRALDLPAQEACRHFESALCPQLAAARHLLPLLAEGGRGAGYVLIGGPACTPHAGVCTDSSCSRTPSAWASPCSTRASMRSAASTTELWP